MKSIVICMTALAFVFSSAAAQAGGWGKKTGNSLVNVSPSVKVGDVGVANGVLSGNAILSGNSVSGILNGNAVGVLNGNSAGIGILNGYKLRKK